MQNFRIPEDKKSALQKFKEYVAEKGEWKWGCLYVQVWTTP